MKRSIKPKMYDYISKKIANHGAAQHAIKTGDARSLFVYVAESLVGIKESGGNNKGPVVELIQQTVGIAQGEAWCMALVQTCLAYVEKCLGVKSPIAISETCTYVWDNTPKSQRVKTAPLPGAIVIWKKGRTWQGHTGIVTEFTGKGFEAVEGNTTSGTIDGKIESDGGGVYITNRGLKGYDNMKVLGFLKPF